MTEPSVSPLVTRLPTETTLFRGPNFSGRSRRLLELNAAAAEQGFFIEPNIIGSFSGVTQTVYEELDYFSSSTASKKRAVNFIESLGMQSILNRDPLSLSGGEQAVAALSSAIGYGVERAFADCCFEQLDFRLRYKIVECFNTYSHGRLIYADNRADEYCRGDQEESVTFLATPETVYARLDNQYIPDRRIDSAALVISDLIASYETNSDFVLTVPHLELNPGQVYRFAGSNGSGKTTLCRVLVGLLKRRSGAMTLGGKNINPWIFPSRAVSLSFQNPDDQLCERTVRSELVLRGCPIQDVEAMVKAFGVACPLEAHPGSLPFVLRKRLSLAAAFSLPRGWYILDEPTLGQDDESVVEIALIIKRLVKSGAGMIIVTHSERFAELVEAIGILLNGGVCATLGDQPNQYDRN